MIRLSLIVPTIGRATELSRLLESLCAQTDHNFEVIVVDQSRSSDLDPVIVAYKDHLPIFHIKSTERGASRARNMGFKAAQGQLIAWPDDDCYYPPHLTVQIGHLFDEYQDWDGIAVCRLDEMGAHDSRMEPTKITRLKPLNFFFMAGEAAIFYRRAVVEAVGEFDRYLGVGAGTLWGAGEAADFQIRAYRQGFQTWFVPHLNIYHPSILFEAGTPVQLSKLKSYARGMGAVLRKQRLPVWFVLAYMGFYLLSPLRALTRFRLDTAKVGWQRFLGLFEGWKNYRSPINHSAGNNTK